MEKLSARDAIKKLSSKRLHDWVLINDLTKEEELEIFNLHDSYLYHALMEKNLRPETIDALIDAGKGVVVLHEYKGELLERHYIKLIRTLRPIDLTVIAEKPNLTPKVIRLLIKAASGHNGYSEVLYRTYINQKLRWMTQKKILWRISKHENSSIVRRMQLRSINVTKKMVDEVLQRGGLYDHDCRALIENRHLGEEAMLKMVDLKEADTVAALIEASDLLTEAVIERVYERFPQQANDMFVWARRETFGRFNDSRIKKLAAERANPSNMILERIFMEKDTLPEDVFEEAVNGEFGTEVQTLAYYKAQIGERRFEERLKDPNLSPGVRKWMRITNPLFSAEEQLVELSKESPEAISACRRDINLSARIQASAIQKLAERDPGRRSEKNRLQAKRMMVDACLTYGEETFSAFAETWEGSFEDLLTTCKELS